jgi:hypothetical protein
MVNKPMKPIKYPLLAIMASLTLASFHPTTPAMAPSATSTVDSRIRLDWEVGTRFGRPVIQGYVYNDYLRAASNVLLSVETLDASGAVIARRVGFVRVPGQRHRVRLEGLRPRCGRRGHVTPGLHGTACPPSHPAIARGGRAAVERLPLRALT